MLKGPAAIITLCMHDFIWNINLEFLPENVEKGTNDILIGIKYLMNIFQILSVQRRFRFAIITSLVWTIIQNRSGINS